MYIKNILISDKVEVATKNSQYILYTHTFAPHIGFVNYNLSKNFSGKSFCRFVSAIRFCRAFSVLNYIYDICFSLCFTSLSTEFQLFRT